VRLKTPIHSSKITFVFSYGYFKEKGKRNPLKGSFLFFPISTLSLFLSIENSAHELSLGNYFAAITIIPFSH